MFALAGVAAFVFPEGEAGAPSVAGGFAPAQVPPQGVPSEERYYASQLQDRYRNPVLCADLGGTLQEVGGEWVCQGLDRAGTFCIVGSQDVFPCRGLFRHVIQCNDVYNRPARDPFLCNLVCGPGAPWEVKARGPNCEFVIPEEEIIAEADRTVNLPNFPAGYTGVLATLQVSLLTFQGTEYESHTLINDRPLGPGVPFANADQLTISAGNVLEIPEYAPLIAGETQRVLVAKNSCPRLPEGQGPSFRGFADFGCYPVFVNITANFAEVIARTDIRLLSVAANLPAAVVTLKTAVGHSGFGYGIALTNTMDYALVNIAYDSTAHDFDPVNGVILLDDPLQAGAPITAEVEADIECRTIQFCNPARISVTVVFEPVAVPPQPPASLPGRDPFILSVPITLPGGYAPSQNFIDFVPGFENAVVATLEVVGIEGYAGDTADFVATDGGNLSNENSNALLSAGDYVFTIQMTAEDLLGMILFEISLNIYPADQIRPDKSIPAGERQIFRALAPGYSGSIAYFQAADSTIGLSTPGPGQDDAPPFSIPAESIGVTLFPPDGVTLFYNPDPAAAAPGETRVISLSFRSEKMSGNPEIEENFLITATVSIVSVPPQETLETDAGEDFTHPLVLPGFNLSEGNFAVLSVVNTDTNQEYTLGSRVFAVANGILRRNREGANPPPPEPGRYDVIVEMTHPDILGPVAMTVAVVARGVLNPAVYNLSAPAAPVLVAPGYAGNLLLQAPANISLSSGTSADARVDLPAAFPVGVSLELEADLREVSPHLTDPLAAEEELEAVLTLTIARGGDLYPPIEQRVTLAVSALAAPAVAEAEAVALPPQNIFAAGGEIINLAAADYENGVYGGANFQARGVSPQLNVGAEGRVSVAADLAVGEYDFTVVAIGRPRASGAQYLGEVEITVSVRVSLGREIAAPVVPDDVVPAGRREANIDAAAGYTGAGYAIPVEGGYEITDESWDSAVFGYDADNKVILITTAVGDAPFSYAVTASASCSAASGRLCNTIDITVTAHFNPVDAPLQADIPAAYLDPFAGGISFPPGYEEAGPNFAARALSIVAVEGWSGDIADLSLSFNGDLLEYDPGGVAANALTPGQYTVGFQMTHPGLLGTLAFEVAANIVRRPLDPAEYGLSAPIAAVVAPGAAVVGLQIGVASLTAGADATIAAPPQTSLPNPPFLTLSLLADSRGIAARIAAPFAEGEERTVEIPLTVSRPGENYAPLEISATVIVRALSRPRLIEESATAVPHSDANVANLKTGDFANATFAKVESESDAELLVDEAAGIISTDGGLGAGIYNIAVDATSPDFLGSLRLSLRLFVNDRAILTPAETVPGDRRSRQIAAVPGYSGSVAFFAAADAGVTLQTPDPAPAGFNFGAGGAGANFVSPAGFTLFLDAGQIPNGGDEAAANFEIIATLAAYEGETVSLHITVLAVGAPEQPALAAPESAAVYGHNLAENPAYPFFRGELRIAGARDSVADQAVADADRRVTIANGQIQPVDGADPGRRLAVGRYVIAVEFTHPNLLGAATLLVTASIQEELNPDRVVPVREVTQPVAVGYSGEGYEIPVDAAHTLSNISYDATGVTLENYNLRIVNPMPNVSLIAALTADAGCADETTRDCAPLQISVTIAYAPVAAPPQTGAAAAYLDDFTHPVALPAGYETGGANFAGRSLSIVGVAGLTDISQLSLSIDGDNLKYAPNGVEADALNAGQYAVTLEMTHGGMLGALTMEISADISPIALDPGEYGLSTLPVPVRVAPGEGGRNVKIGAVSLTAGADATVSPLPQGAEFRASLFADNRGFALYTRRAYSSRDERYFAYTVVVSRANPNYALETVVSAGVSVLFQPPVLEISAEGAPTYYSSASIANFKTGDYANGTFEKVEEGAATGLEIGRDSGIVSGDNLGAGTHTLTAGATSPDFVGTARLELRLTVVLPPPEADDVLAVREITRPVAVGHFGPPGHVIALSANYRFANPSLDAAQISLANGNEALLVSPMPESDVVATLDADVECIDAAVGLCGTLRMSVTIAFTPVSAPAQTSIGAVFLNGFTHPLALPAGYETGGANFAGRALSVSGVNGRAEGAADLSLAVVGDSLEYAPNGAEANALKAGQYTVTVAMTQSDLLGTVYLEIPAKISSFAELNDLLSIAIFQSDPFDAELVGSLLTLGADPDHADADGEALLIRAAQADKHLAVSILITAGADPDARSPTTNRQVPHWAARGVRLDVLRYYIAAVGQVGRSYDWNDVADAGTPLRIFQNWHGGDRSAKAREVAALIYERGGRCAGSGGFYCDTVPTETRNTVIADAARGDVFTLVARDFGAAEFDLALPDANALTVLASIGWTLRLDAAERPHRVVLERGETTNRRAAMFTITAQFNGAEVRHYMVSARLESAEDDPDAALAEELAKDAPDSARIAELLNQGADVNHTDDGGEALLIRMARADKYLAVSILITLGADPEARSPTTNRQVPHWAARDVRLEVLRHYIAAVGRVGHSHDWNNGSDAGTPLRIFQNWHGNDRSAEALEVAALIYERGGRCSGSGGGFYCDNVPAEEIREVIADAARGDVFTIVARDFGAAEFTLSLPAAGERTLLENIGWTLRLDAAERPHRIVLERGETTNKRAAIFTITAQYNGEIVRRYMVSARLESAVDNPDAALAAESREAAPDSARVADFLNQGADIEQVNQVGDSLLLQAARNERHLAVSVLVVAGANPASQGQGGFLVPSWAARLVNPDVMRHYIAAIGQIGYSYPFWNHPSTPLDIVQNWHGSNRNARTRETAALIYERGGRCVQLTSGFYCDNVPLEERNLLAPDAPGDVFTIVARDLGATQFDLPLPETDELTILASLGWTLRLDAAERPHRVVLERAATTLTAAAVFTITARNGGTDVRHYRVTARLSIMVDDPSAELFAELSKASPDASWVAELLRQGATLAPIQADEAGALMLQAARDNNPPLVSVLITAGADADAHIPGNNRQVPHFAARGLRLEVLRHYIAAIGLAGHEYDWNSAADAGTPLQFLQNWHGGNRSATAREIAALIYERGGRCASGYHCETVPFEEHNPVVADAARGDVFTIVARSLGAAEFTLALPEAEARTILASIGWTLRLDAAEHPHRAVLERGETTRLAAAVFTITAQYGGDAVRHYIVSARLESAEADPNAALEAELSGVAPDLSRVAELQNQGADVNRADKDGEALLLRMAKADKHLAVSILIVLGADPEARNPATNRQVAHFAARGLRLEVLRYYIAAIGLVGHSHDWNNGSDAGTPLNILQNWHGGNRGAEAREFAALIYERGGRCGGGGFYCDTVPTETRSTVIADDTRGDVLTIVARDFGAAEFTLALPEAEARTILASIGWTLRLDAAEHPHRAILERGETTSKQAAVFTITAQYDGDAVRHYIVSARLAGAEADPNAALAEELAKDAPDSARIAELLNQGADVNHTDDGGEALLLRMARADKYLAVSILITLGADPEARTPTSNRQVPHWAARDVRLEVLRYYIAAIGLVGHSHDWNNGSDAGTPLNILQNWHGGNRGAEAREFAALIYERGGRCGGGGGFYCDNVPTETRSTVIADDTRGDILTIVARDFGTAEFTLALPEAEARTILASIGWTLRLDAVEHPHRAILERGETTSKQAAVFTITAQYDGDAVRHYIVSARLAGAEADPNAALAEELAKDAPDSARIAELLNQGADVNHTDDGGEALLLRMARADKHLAVSILITLGADPEARTPTSNRQVPHWAARDARLEVLRYYIAAIGRVGHSHDWNNGSDVGTPLNIFQNWHGGNRGAEAREIAALIYERGGRCAGGGGFYCDTVPTETRSTVIADDARGDVLTIVARDFGAAEFTLSLPEAEARTILASIGWTLRLDAAERPHRAILERGETTSKQAAVFTITAQYDGDAVRHYIVSARLAGAEADPDAALAEELTRVAPSLTRVAELVNQGADVNHEDDSGEALLLRMAQADKHLAVSILIVSGADPEARSPATNRQVPHWAARDIRLEVLRYYIAAIGQVGRSYNWNSRSDNNRLTPLGIVQNWHGGDRGAEALEIAALIYERGGRCNVAAGYHCDTVPFEERGATIADDARGDVFTLFARDFGAAEFDLALPDAGALTVLASIGWTLRLDAAERPHRVVLGRSDATNRRAAIFTITARFNGADVRRHMVSARLESAADDPDAALAAELTMLSPSPSLVADLLKQGATLRASQTGKAGEVMLQAAADNMPEAVDILIAAGADLGARHPSTGRQIPHWAAAHLRLEELRRYIAAIGQAGYSYNWSSADAAGDTPLGVLQNSHGGDRGAAALEIAALIYERGGRCQSGLSGFYCDTVPAETRNTVVADDARGDVLTLVARDFGAAEFDLALPDAGALTVLASIGWTLRLDAAERPHRVVLERGETTSKQAAVFTITAQFNGAGVRHYMVSARLASAVDDPDAALAAEAAKFSPSASLVADFLNQGANFEQRNGDGDTPLLQAARNGRHLAVSVLILAGADPGAQSRPGVDDYQVPHWAAVRLRPEVLRHYIAAIGAVDYSYNWNNSVSYNRPPLGHVQFLHGQSRTAAALEIAALIYERGGRCSGTGFDETRLSRTGIYCDNVPAEDNALVVADDALGDVLTLVARDLGKARFDLAPPAADELTVLASIGWSVRREDAERPHRIILTRDSTVHMKAAVFTITARGGGVDVRYYRVSARNESFREDESDLLAAELGKIAPQLSRVVSLLIRGATLRADLADAAGTLAVQAAVNMPRAVSILITAGANPEIKQPIGLDEQIPHLAARALLPELMRHFIAAIEAVGHPYDWNTRSTSGTPFESVHFWNTTDSEARREIAALTYARGSRCFPSVYPASSIILRGKGDCDVPTETRSTVIADDARGDVLTLAARNFGTVLLDLTLPEADELTVLASVGWSLRRDETERPHRVILTRNETTRKVAAVFTITARNGSEDVLRYRVSARLASAADDPDAALAAEMTMLSPSASLAADLVNQGADTEQVNHVGDSLLLQAARGNRASAVSILIAVGADPGSRNSAINYQVPHWAVRELRLEVLRHYIAAIGQVGHSYDWNDVSNNGTPLEIIQNWHGSDRSAEALEVAALIYERGGRCPGGSGFYCDTVPAETRNTVVADDARGDVFTIVARDFGAAEFDFSLPEAGALTALASIGWTLRVDAAERPHRVVLARGETTSRRAAVFTITAQFNGEDVRRYMVSARLASAADNPDAALRTEAAKFSPSASLVADLAKQGANFEQKNGGGDTLLLQAARGGRYLAVSVLILAGADPDARSGVLNNSYQVPHWAVSNLRPEVLRHFIAAIGAVDHSYNWNNRVASDRPPLEQVQFWHGNNRTAEALEIAALIYERGGRCTGFARPAATGAFCDNVPLEERITVIADDALGEVLTLVARDLGKARFDLALPAADELTVLASIGWSVRREDAERPHRIILTRDSTVHLAAAVFTVTARGGGGGDVRHYRVLARPESVPEDVNAALAAELEKPAPQVSQAVALLSRGATLRADLAGAAGTLALQAGLNNNPRAVSILITAGAYPEAERGGFREHIPHIAARELWPELLRHYIAAIEAVGHPYDWNHQSTSGTPWETLRFRHPADSETKREMGALLYARGSRCLLGAFPATSLIPRGEGDCDIPTETLNTVIADDARGDVVTLAARHFGTVLLDLTLPEAEALTVLASVGWSLRRDETERPHRVVLTRNETTRKVAAVFTITARNGSEDVRHYRVSARLAGAVDDPDAALAAEMTMLSPDLSRVRDFLNQGADTEQVDNGGDTLLLQAARNDRHLLMSILITAGANPDARSPTSSRQVPHWAARDLRLEVLRHYIAAIGQVGRSYDWNDVSDAGTPLGILQGWHGSDRSAGTREMAALIYERGGRCQSSISGFYCDNVPAETRNTVIADDARGDVLTIVARDFGAAEFDLPLPGAEALTVLASIGWTLRLETERPRRVVLTRGETARKVAAVFTITAQYGGTVVRHYMVSARLASAVDDPDAALAAEMTMLSPDLSRVRDFLNQGADTEQVDNGGDTLLLQAARNDRHLLMSILITAGANPDARSPTSNRQVPHWAARDLRLEVLRHYIAAIGRVGHSYDWSSSSDIGSPLFILQFFHGSDRSAEAREIAALLYERGGRCGGGVGFYCDNVPAETRATVIADNTRRDVFTIVARDFGAAEFDLALPEADALAALASVGWLLRREDERPQRIILEQNNATIQAAAFTITARNGGTDVRHYKVEAVNEILKEAVRELLSEELAAELGKGDPQLSVALTLLSQGATLRADLADKAGALALQAAIGNMPQAVSILITAGANPDARRRQGGVNQQIPHVAAERFLLEVLRHYISAIDAVGHAYDWNSNSTYDGTPYEGVHISNRSDVNGHKREIAALLYERGSRCVGGLVPGQFPNLDASECDVPSDEQNLVIADAARGDVFTIVARDFSAAVFDLSLPEAEALAALASVGWTLRLDAAERPHRVVLERGETTRKVAAVFTITARNGSEDVRHYMVSARLASAVDDPDAALAAEMTMLSPNAALAADLVSQGADTEQANNAGDTLLLQAARNDRHSAVSILIAVGANPDARSPTSNRQVPHWATRENFPESLRHYIAAIGQVGYSYDWNNVSDIGTPLGILQGWHGSDRSARTREMAALIYERGGRCPGRNGFYCDNVPTETRNTVIADDARGDVFTIVARDLGAAEFDLSLPEAEALTVLASIGWTLRLEAERPHRVVLERGETTRKVAAVFTITAQYGGTVVRHYRVSARLASAVDDPDAALAAEVTMLSPSASLAADLVNQGADTEQTNNDGDTLLLKAAENGMHQGVSVLIIVGANPDAKNRNELRVPHAAAHYRQLEVLRYYIAAIGQIGYSYAWNRVESDTPLDWVQYSQGTDAEQIAALIYERGGRCLRRSGFYCDTVPSERRNTVIADDARGDVLTIVARDFGAAEFDLALPEADELTVLASIGWTLRLEAERPHRVVLTRGETTRKVEAVFTITAQYGGTVVRHYMVSARLAGAVDDPDAALAAEMTMLSPNASLAADLVSQGADVEQANNEGDTLLLQAARNNRAQAVSILIAVGADPAARTPGVSRQVPHLAAIDGHLELLRHYIAAIGQVGRSYDWNDVESSGYTPLDWVQTYQGSRPVERREIAALIYERGGRCAIQSGTYCDNVPSETRNTVIADDAQGDVLTIIARDFGAAQFDLSLPDENALTVLASIGLSLRLQTERPQRIVAARNDMTMTMRAIFTVTARNGGTVVRHYAILVRTESDAVADAALAAEVAKDAPDLARIVDLANQGADVNQTDDSGEPLLLQAADDNKYLAVSVLITLGADPDARSSGNNLQVPHLAAIDGHLELLRHYIAAIGQVGRSYDWNDVVGGHAPLDEVQFWHGSRPVEQRFREIAGLIYERGGRCARRRGTYCDIPLETRNTVIADDARGDVLTIVARDFGAAEFDLALPEADELTVLAGIGLSLRLETERPQRIVVARNDMTMTMAAVFTITARNDGADVRHYIISAGVEGASGFAPPITTPGRSGSDGLRTANLSRNPDAPVVLSRSGVKPPTGSIHPRESRGTTDRKQESRSWRVSGFGIAGRYLARVERSELEPVGG